MTIDSDSEKETATATAVVPQGKQQNQKKSNKQGKKVAAVQMKPIPAEEEDIMVNKEFNLEDIAGSIYAKAKGDGKVQVVDGKYENKTLWSYSDAVKIDRTQTQGDSLYDTSIQGQ